MFLDLNRASVVFQFLFQISLPALRSEESESGDEQLFKGAVSSILAGHKPSDALLLRLRPIFDEAWSNPR